MHLMYYLKQNSISFHKNDYGYYIEFLHKYKNPDYPQAYTINPLGRNFMKIVAMDGSKSMVQNIHFEPIRFVELAIYRIFNSEYAVTIFRFLILLLIFLAFRNTNFSPWILLFLFFSGASLNLFLYDLRTYYYIPIIFSALFLSWKFNKKTLLPFYILSFLIREEFLILNLFLLGFILIKQIKANKTEIGLFHKLIAIWGFFVLMNLGYFYYWYNDQLFSKLSILLLLILGGLIFYCFKPLFINRIIEAILNLYHRFIKKIPIEIFLFVPILYIIFKSSYLSGAIKSLDVEWIKSSLFLERFNTLLYFTLFVMIILFTDSNSKAYLLKTFVILNCIYYLVLLGINLSEYLPKIDTRKELMNVYKKNNFNDKTLFTDYTTFQVFAKHRKLYNFERLPAYMFNNVDERHYPENEDILYELIKNKDVFILNSSSEETEKFLNKLNYNIIKESDFFISGIILKND